MLTIAAVTGLILAIALFIAGVSRKKIGLSVLAAVTGIFLLGLLAILILANSPFWTM